MRILIRDKIKNADGRNVIIRDFDHVKVYYLYEETNILEVLHEDEKHRVLYPLSRDEYVCIMPDAEDDDV